MSDDILVGPAPALGCGHGLHHVLHRVCGGPAVVLHIDGPLAVVEDAGQEVATKVRLEIYVLEAVPIAGMVSAMPPGARRAPTNARYTATGRNDFRHVSAEGVPCDHHAVALVLEFLDHRGQIRQRLRGRPTEDHAFDIVGNIGGRIRVRPLQREHRHAALLVHPNGIRDGLWVAPEIRLLHFALHLPLAEVGQHPRFVVPVVLRANFRARVEVVHIVGHLRKLD
mmetsp:Transcript_127948/g.368630  ORF Transcript_127948/g.368630 Transcript_127948/m.368630 type:complete len:225 (-) Transcript_127948:504-1178(-)